MHQFLTPPSPAERMLFLAYLGVAASGALLGSQSLAGIAGLVDTLGPGSAQWVLVLASAVGACIACALLREKFGYKKKRGAFRAIFGALLATATLGIVAGTFLLPILGTMFGPWLLFVTILTQPVWVLPWVAALIGLQLAFVAYREEQATIFRHLRRIDTA